MARPGIERPHLDVAVGPEDRAQLRGRGHQPDVALDVIAMAGELGARRAGARARPTPNVRWALGG